MAARLAPAGTVSGRWPALLLALGLSACSTLPEGPGRTISYRCEAGRDFTVTYSASGERAVVALDRMTFNLLAEPAGTGQSFACSVLTLSRTAAGVRLELEGREIDRNCREKSP